MKSNRKSKNKEQNLEKETNRFIIYYYLLFCWKSKIDFFSNKGYGRIELESGVWIVDDRN